jgi:hypothetical protein
MTFHRPSTRVDGRAQLTCNQLHCPAELAGTTPETMYAAALRAYARQHGWRYFPGLWGRGDRCPNHWTPVTHSSRLVRQGRR